MKNKPYIRCRHAMVYIIEVTYTAIDLVLVKIEQKLIKQEGLSFANRKILLKKQRGGC